MKKFLVIFFLCLSLLFNTNTKADPLTNILITEGIGVGIKIVEFSIEKIKDLNKNYISKKKDKKKLDKLDEGSHIITFSNCKGLEPNYLPNTRFLIDHKNQYVRIIEGIDKKEIYYKIKNISGSRIIARELFTLNKKDEKKINEINKNIKVLNIFDLNKKTIEIDIRINPGASKKWEKIFKKDIKKGDLAIYTNAKCIVDGEEILLKEKKKKIDQKATWIAIVEHKEKKLFYTSDNSSEINTKQKAINNATSKCWFDPKHKEGDWPSENCKVISAKNADSNNAAAEKAKAYADMNALKKLNEQWIVENKQKYIDEFKEKLNEYKSLISRIEIKRNELNNQFETLEKINSGAKQKITNAFDTINTANLKIKSIKKEITKNEKLYLLSDTDLMDYNNLLKKISEIKFEYYNSLKKLIKKAKQSSKKKHFVGYKFLTGVKNAGFIEEFKIIKSQDLGSNSVENNIDKLTNDIDQKIKDIDKFILKPVDNLFILDDELLTGNNYNYLFMGNQFYSLYKLINHIVY